MSEVHGNIIDLKAEFLTYIANARELRSARRYKPYAEAPEPLFGMAVAADRIRLGLTFALSDTSRHRPASRERFTKMFGTLLDRVRDIDEPVEKYLHYFDASMAMMTAGVPAAA